MGICGNKGVYLFNYKIFQRTEFLCLEKFSPYFKSLPA